MRASAHPAIWVAAAWGLIPLLLAGAVLSTGGAASPALIWFALPAVTLGARFEPRGIAIGTAYILALLLLCTIALDPAAYGDHNQSVDRRRGAGAQHGDPLRCPGRVRPRPPAPLDASTRSPASSTATRSSCASPSSTASAGERAGRLPRPAALRPRPFKRVNDRLGHTAGDAVLQEVAHTMRAVLRAGDSIYRVGGEEILVVLPGATQGGRGRRSPSACGSRSATCGRSG